MVEKNLVKVAISDNREVHIQINSYKNRTELDIRTFILTPKPTGEPIGYTPKGVRVPIPKGKEIVEAINQVLKAEGA